MYLPSSVLDLNFHADPDLARISKGIRRRSGTVHLQNKTLVPLILEQYNKFIRCYHEGLFFLKKNTSRFVRVMVILGNFCSHLTPDPHSGRGSISRRLN
jgi:hypothetical protein